MLKKTFLISLFTFFVFHYTLVNTKAYASNDQEEDINLEKDMQDAFQLNRAGEQHHFKQHNFKKALECYTKAVALGSAEAANHIGRLYANGEGVIKDPYTAQKWYKKSIELDPSLENKCINGYYSNSSLCGLVRASLQNSAPAEYELAMLYRIGTPEIRQDLKKALKLFEKSAKKNYAPAALELSICYLNGLGVEKSIDKSNYWKNKAENIVMSYELNQGKQVLSSQ